MGPSCRRFEGRVALVTGASQGIGRATALELAREGALLVLNARGAEALGAVADEARRLGGPCHAVTGDVCDPATADALVDRARAEFGRLDVLVSNVGGGSNLRPVEEVDEEEWARVLERNLHSAFRLCRAAARVMRGQESGRIVTVSSVGGRTRSHLSGIPYSAAKAGLEGLTRHLAWDLGPSGITVNAVAPGLTATARAEEKWGRLDEGARERILGNVALRRFADPLEVARAVLFLASDDASYVTGTTLDVSGGILLA